MSLQLDTRLDDFIGAVVSVAFNRHKKLWSIRKGGRVVGYTEELLLSNATFTVSEAGRRKAIETGKRNVHAFVRGTLLNVNTAPHWPDFIPITYNPFRSSRFVNAETYEPMSQRRAWVIARGTRMYVNS